MQMLGSRQGGDDAPGGHEAPARQAPPRQAPAGRPAPQPQGNGFSDMDDDIPF